LDGQMRRRVPAWTFPGSLNNGEQSQLLFARRQRADVQQARN
jgi:hypothetical protein